MVRFAAILALVLAPAAAWAGGFSGFSTDGSVILVGTDRVCRPIRLDGRGVARTQEPECQRVASKKAVKAYGFKKPAATKSFTASVHGTTVRVYGDKKVILLWHAPGAVEDVQALYLSPGRGLLALEVLVPDKTKKGRPRVETVAFDVQGLIARPKPGKIDRPKTAFERAMQKGGVWEQRIVPCERAGVKLVVEKTGRFRLDIDLRCKAQRDGMAFDGTWEGQGADKLSLTFPNDDGTSDTITCAIRACENDASQDCLECALGDVGFTLMAVERP